MNSVEELCALIGRRITWGPGEDASSLTADTPLLEMGLVDSLAIMEIVAALDKEAGVTLPDTEIVAANFRSPKALWAAIESLAVEGRP
ncbi:acyl carrier protein [Streptomyces coelicoflavus]|uniref:acyl carrier protein n=1 Tax=Streptomyces coelicoflavus TaxID=285562 RepID=UPI003690A5F6